MRTLPVAPSETSPESSIPTGKGSLRLLATVLLAPLLALAACQSSKPSASNTSQGATATPSPSTSSSVDPAVADATAKATAAYQGYVTAYAHAARSADISDPGLAKYMGGGLLSLSRHNLRQLADRGAIEVGTPTATVTSTKTDLSAAPPTVTINACVDYSTYRLVYKSNQSPVPNSALPFKRYTTTATVQRFANGAWLVSADDPHRDTPC